MNCGREIAEEHEARHLVKQLLAGVGWLSLVHPAIDMGNLLNQVSYREALASGEHHCPGQKLIQLGIHWSANARRRKRVRANSIADGPEIWVVTQDGSFQRRLAVDTKADSFPAIAIHLVNERCLIEQQLAEPPRPRAKPRIHRRP